MTEAHPRGRQVRIRLPRDAEARRRAVAGLSGLEQDPGIPGVDLFDDPAD